MNSPVEVSRWRAFSSCAMPKSVTLASPEGSTITLAGLMSRCTTPRACAKPRARDLGDGLHDALPLGLALALELGERLAPQQLERDEERAARVVAPDVVHDDDARMLQLRGDPGLVQEALLVALELVRLRGRSD